MGAHASKNAEDNKQITKGFRLIGYEDRLSQITIDTGFAWESLDAQDLISEMMKIYPSPCSSLSISLSISDIAIGQAGKRVLSEFLNLLTKNLVKDNYLLFTISIGKPNEIKLRNLAELVGDITIANISHLNFNNSDLGILLAGPELLELIDKIIGTKKINELSMCFNKFSAIDPKYVPDLFKLLFEKGVLRLDLTYNELLSSSPEIFNAYYESALQYKHKGTRQMYCNLVSGNEWERLRERELENVDRSSLITLTWRYLKLFDLDHSGVMHFSSGAFPLRTLREEEYFEFFMKFLEIKTLCIENFETSWVKEHITAPNLLWQVAQKRMETIISGQSSLKDVSFGEYQLSENQYFELFSRFLEAKGSNVSEAFENQVQIHIENPNLLWQFAQKHMEIILLNDSDLNINFQVYKLSDQQRLKLFVRCLANSEADNDNLPERIELAKKFDLLATDLPVSTLLRGIEDLSTDDLDLDEIANLQQEEILVFHRNSKAVWKEADFHENCFEKLKTFDCSDVHNLIKLCSMYEWFMWTLVAITDKPELNFNHLLFPRLLQEVLEFPDPKMRYSLGEIILSIFEKPHQLGEFQKLIEKQPSKWKLLPSLVIFKLVYQEETVVRTRLSATTGQAERTVSVIMDYYGDAHTDDLVKISERILHLLSNDYKIGNATRLFIGAVFELAESSTLPPIVSLKLLCECLEYYQKPALELQECEELLKQAINKFSYQQKELQQQKTLEQIREAFQGLKGLSDNKTLQQPFLQPYLTEDSFWGDRNHFGPLRRTWVQHLAKTLNEQRLKKEISFWLLIQGLGSLQSLDLVQNLKGPEIEFAASKVLARLLRVEPERFANYSKVFAGIRNEGGLLTYLGKIRSLKEPHKDQLEALYTQFILAMLSDDPDAFLKLRYSLKNPHMESLLLENPELVANWRAGKKVPLEEFVEQYKIAAKPIEIDYAHFIYDKVFKHKHLDPEKFSLPLLQAYCESKEVDEKNRIKVELEEDELKTQQEEQGMLKLQRLLIAFLETEQRDRKQQINLLNRILKQVGSIDPKSEFKRDVENLKLAIFKALHTRDRRNSNLKGYTIEDSVVPWSLFNMGSDMEGSCQHIGGYAPLNQCLLAYIWDDKNRLWLISDPHR